MTKTNQQFTKKSHYVPQFYLKKFSGDDGKLWVRDKVGNIFQKSPSATAFQEYLYSMEKPISYHDLFAVTSNRFNSKDQKEFRELLKSPEANTTHPRDWKNLFLFLSKTFNRGILDFIFNLICYLNNDVPFDYDFSKNNFTLEQQSEIRMRLNKNYLMAIPLQNQELLFQFYEDNFNNHVFNQLIAGNVNFLNNNDMEYKRSIYFFGFHIVMGKFFLKTYLVNLKNNLKDSNTINPFSKKSEKDEYINYINEKIKKINKNDDSFNSILSQFPNRNINDLSLFYFLTYILTQKMRTAEIKNITSKISPLNNTKNIYAKKANHSNFLILVSHFYIHNLALNLISDNYKIVLLNNESKLNFITSDLPVINIFSTVNELIDRDKRLHELKKDEYELYFPLSPRKALILTKFPFFGNTTLNEDDVKRYNGFIAKKASKYLYSDSEESLNGYFIY